MRIALLMVVSFALSGCLTAESRQAKDDAECRSYGLSVGTDMYAQCRMRIAAGRDARRAAAIQSLDAPVIEPYSLTANEPHVPQQRLEATCTTRQGVGNTVVTDCR